MSSLAKMVSACAFVEMYIFANAFLAFRIHFIGCRLWVVTVLVNRINLLHPQNLGDVHVDEINMNFDLNTI